MPLINSLAVGIPSAPFTRLAKVFVIITALALFACGAETGSRDLLRITFPDTLSVQVRLPTGHDSTRAYPILIGLHGRGGDADGFSTLWNGISKHNVIYLVPEAPFPFGNGFAWFRNQTPDSARIAQDRTRSEDLIAAVARAALARYGGSKAYMLGFSQGGNLAYHTALRYRDIFQGVIAFGAYLDIKELSPDKIRGAKGLKAFITHGTEDRVIAFHEGEAAHRNLKNMGSEVDLRRFSGGHVVDDESLAIALDWMFYNKDIPGKSNPKK